MSGGPAIHPVVAAAAEGRLPDWARASESRIEHMGRVAELLHGWAGDADIPESDRLRWVAAGWLHDCLKDEDEARMRALVEPTLLDLPEPVLHGPAAAARLRREGVADEELLTAVAYHTLGHRSLGALGRALYAADFLEPGRDLRNEWRADLRARMPADMEGVVKAILRARILHLVEAGRAVRQETVAFWNHLAGGEPWARASEV